jgi:CheY-like chemotaxis protein
MSERYCILCVDDDHIGLGLRAALLENEGYSVTAGSCPLRALEFDVTKFHLASTSSSTAERRKPPKALTRLMESRA